jgi:tetratricopeptide (TPR) repeat protein
LEKGKVLPPGGFKLMGDLYYGLGDVREALSHYLREAAVTKDNAELLGALAMSHEQLGELEQALVYWKQVCELNPKDARANKRVRALRQKMRKKGKGS